MYGSCDDDDAGSTSTSIQDAIAKQQQQLKLKHLRLAAAAAAANAKVRERYLQIVNVGLSQFISPHILQISSSVGATPSGTPSSSNTPLSVRHQMRQLQPATKTPLQQSVPVFASTTAASISTQHLPTVAKVKVSFPKN